MPLTLRMGPGKPKGRMAMMRRPTEKPIPRMEPLARLPVFLALEGKRALVVGSSGPAVWKAELLSAAGARVDVYAINPSDDLVALAAAPPRGPITIVARPYEAGDFRGMAVAVGAIEEAAEASKFAAAARAARVPVNVVDRPELCDFAFGAIVNRSPLVVGISTDGASPVFGQAIRAKLEALIPQGFSRWAQAAHAWRPQVQARALSFRARRLFWERFTARAIARPDALPGSPDLESLLTHTGAPQVGSVTLVGAGPGDPELLTLRAVRALQTADVILIDDLVAPEILDFARREAKKLMVGKTGHKPSCKQEEINELMISLAKAGRHVVRLKGGDPGIFARAGEEIAACRAQGIAVEIIPGVTAAQAAASRLGISLTHRRHARRLQYVTGHGVEGHLPDLDWSSLADPAVTTVVYMPKRTLGDLAAATIAHGLDPGTPALIVGDATRPGETVIRGTIGDIAERIGANPPEGPALLMIGRVLGLEAAASEPLDGCSDANAPRDHAALAQR
jgi:uroporphyrin-III C-methyltransferase / precorrin-2 dehydrogenase / sirohydrochlorin ferrochelatase